MSDVVEKQIKEMLTRYMAEIRKASDEAKKSGQDMANGLKAADTQIKALLTTTQKLNADGSITETRKGYDELGRSITEVYKAGQLLNRSVSSESALSSDIKRANDLYKEQLASIKKIYDLKTKRLTNGRQMDEGKEAGSEFIKTSGNPSELLELEEKGFHKVALLVEPPVDEPRVGIIFPWRDTEIRIVVGDELTKPPLAVGSVSENGRPLEVNLANQFLSDSNVRSVSCGQQNCYGVAQSVYSGVNLGASAATAHSNALINLGFHPDSVLLLGGGLYGFGGF